MIVMVDKMFIAAKAFINFNGKILVLRESTGYKDGSNEGKFDVVGGRIKIGENFYDSLIREIKEETNLKVKIGKPFFVHEWRPVVRDERWQVIAVFVECFADSDKVTLSQDHDKYLWITPENYKEYTLIENLYLTFEAYIKE